MKTTSSHQLHYKGWTFVSSIPVKDLPLFMLGLFPGAPVAFRCRWKTKGIIRSADVVAWNQVNPREGNNLELQVGEAKKNSPALSKVLWCNGRMDCTPPATASNKRMTACGKQARWAIFSDDLQTAWIYHTGSHGERFALYHDALPVPAFLKKEILSRDGLETSAGGLITASSARRQLEAGAMSGLPAAIPKELLPSVAKIQDIIAYGRRKQRGQQGLPLTRQERLQQALSRPTMAPFLGGASERDTFAPSSNCKRLGCESIPL